MSMRWNCCLMSFRNSGMRDWRLFLLLTFWIRHTRYRIASLFLKMASWSGNTGPLIYRRSNSLPKCSARSYRNLAISQRNDERNKETQESKNEANNVLNIKNLGQRGSIQPFDLKVNQGEVVGLAGLLGSGRTEMARLSLGLTERTKVKLMSKAGK